VLVASSTRILARLHMHAHTRTYAHAHIRTHIIYMYVYSHCTRVVQFEVQPKVQVRGLSRILQIWKAPFEVRSKFDKLLRVRQTLQHASVTLQGTAAPPSSVPLFPCSKSNMSNDLYMKYDL